MWQVYTRASDFFVENVFVNQDSGKSIFLFMRDPNFPKIQVFRIPKSKDFCFGLQMNRKFRVATEIGSTYFGHWAAATNI
jgi:hypothetical protein